MPSPRAAHCASLLIAGLAAVHLWIGVAQAAAPPSLELEALTTHELSAALELGMRTALVPIGGTEQSGPALALGKHNVRARLLAERIAAELGNALVAPVIAYVPEGQIDPPTEHMRMAGTLSVPDAAFEAVLEGCARSLHQHGFTTVVFLGDHGGYQKSLTAVAARLDRRLAGSGTRVIALHEYYDAAAHGFAALLRERGFSEAEIGTHAGLADTALSLALDPGDVRTRELDGAGRAPGVSGDPRRATAQLGELGVNLIVQRSVAAIRATTPAQHAP